MSRLTMRNCVPTAVFAAAQLALSACAIDEEISSFGAPCDDDTPCPAGLVCTSVDDAQDRPLSICTPDTETPAPSLTCDAPVHIVEGDVTLDSDSDLDALPDDVQVITGSLAIGTDVSRIARLAKLCRVDGSVRLERSAIEGLALPELRLVGGDLLLVDNPVLTAVSLPTLSQVGGSLGVGALRTVEPGDVGCEDNVDAPCSLKVGNPELTSLDLTSLVQIDGGLVVAGNAALPEVRINVTVAREVVVARNNALATIALPSLSEASRMVLVEENPSLESILMPALTRVRRATDEDSAELDAARGFLPNGSLWIWTTSGLQGIDGSFVYQVPSVLDFESLETVDGELRMHDVQAETLEFPVLANADSVAFIGNYVNNDNGSPIGGLRSLLLPSLVDLSNDEEALRLQDNELLTSFIAPGLVNADGDVVLIHNVALVDADFGGLETVAGQLQLSENAGLENMCAFRKLAHVESLSVQDHARLASLDGLSLLTSITDDNSSTTDLVVVGNSSLPSCQVDALKAQAGVSLVTQSGNSAATVDCTIDASACP